MFYLLAKIALYRMKFWHRLSQWCWPMEDEWHYRFDRVLDPIEMFALRRKNHAVKQWVAYHGVKVRK